MSQSLPHYNADRRGLVRPSMHLVQGAINPFTADPVKALHFAMLV